MCLPIIHFMDMNGDGQLSLIQLTASSRRENGGAYGGDVFGGKWVVSKGKIFQITRSV